MTTATDDAPGRARVRRRDDPLLPPSDPPGDPEAPPGRRSATKDDAPTSSTASNKRSMIGGRGGTRADDGARASVGADDITDDAGRGRRSPSSSLSSSSNFLPFAPAPAIRPAMESLPPDVSAHLLSHLLPFEIRSVSLASKALHKASFGGSFGSGVSVVSGGASGDPVDDRLKDDVEGACEGKGGRSDASELLWRSKFLGRWNLGGGRRQNEGRGLGGIVKPEEEVYRRGLAGWDHDDDDESGTSDDDDSSDDDEPRHPKSTQENERLWPSSCMNSFTASTVWQRSYANAHSNPHDLWLLHETCALPVDGDLPGRTVIPDLRIVSDPNDDGDGDYGRDRDGMCCRKEKNNDGCHNIAEHVDAQTGDVGKSDVCPRCRSHPLLRRRPADWNEALKNERAFSRQCEESLVAREGSDGGGDASEDKDEDEDKEQDPVSKAETTAAAHAMLLQNAIDVDQNNNGEHSYPPNYFKASDFDSDGAVMGRLRTAPARTVAASGRFSLAKIARNARLDGIKVDRGKGGRRMSESGSEEPVTTDWDADATVEGKMEEEEPETGGDNRGASSSSRNRPFGRMKKAAIVGEDPSATTADDGRLRSKMHRRRSRALRAFSQAGTYRRSVNPEQYRSSGLSFLTDALFFGVGNGTGGAGDGIGGTSGLEEVGTVGGADGDDDGDDAGRRAFLVDRELEHLVRDVYGDDAVDAFRKEQQRAAELIPGQVSGAPNGKEDSVPFRPTRPSFAGRILDPGAGGTIASLEREDGAVNGAVAAAVADPNAAANANNNNAPVNNNGNGSDINANNGLFGPRASPTSLASVSRHSWHVARLHNPDFLRPITYRIHVARPDCFYAFPSEGTLLPGRSTTITFGVKPLGSLIAYAADFVDLFREEARSMDPLLAEVFAREGTLPRAPFAVRYAFAPVVPCVPPHFRTRDDRPRQPAGAGAAAGQPLGPFAIPPPPPRQNPAADRRVSQRSVTEYMWEAVLTEADIRTMYVSAHVHGGISYPLQDLEERTLCPFDLGGAARRGGGIVGRKSATKTYPPDTSPPFPLVFLAPDLQQRDHDLFSLFHGTKYETSSSDAGNVARTEKACLSCESDWGVRTEELGRAYCIRRAVCEVRKADELREEESLEECVAGVKGMLKVLSKHPVDETAKTVRDEGSAAAKDEKCVILERRLILERAARLLRYCHTLVVRCRGRTTISRPRGRRLLKCEMQIETLSVLVLKALSPGPHASDARIPSPFASALRKNPGVYPRARCTDALDASRPPSTSVLFGSAAPPPVILKEEPVDPNVLLHHAPGLLALGPHEDPNHDSGLLSSRHQASDMFQEDALLSFKSALAVIGDPRSLLVRGVYDRVKYSTVLRCLYDGEELCDSPSGGCPSRSDLLMQEKSAGMFRRWGREMIRGGDYREAIRRGHALSLTGARAFVLREVTVRLNDPDPEGWDLIAELLRGPLRARTVHWTTLSRYVENSPHPGVGRFALSRILRSTGTLVPMSATHGGSLGGREGVNVLHHQLPRPPVPPPPPAAVPPPGAANPQPPLHPAPPGGGPRILTIVWLISSRLGWYVDDERNPNAVFVDRRVLIAAQWLGNTLMAWPLILSLLARSLGRMTTCPMDYHLEGLPFYPNKKMRYLTPQECGRAAFALLFLYFVMGRYSERHIGRSYERVMLERRHCPSCGASRRKKQRSRVRRFASFVSLLIQRVYDTLCPLFLQRWIFAPSWNLRSQHEIVNYVNWCRSTDLREHVPGMFYAEVGLGKLAVGTKLLDQGDASAKRKVLMGLVAGAGSFMSSSPHFFLNLLTVFSCSIGLGMSMSLQTFEAGRGSQMAASSRLAAYGLNTVIMGFFLVGQLVGCSGGILFLAEFLVTAASLLLGGAATISTNAVENWMCFFILSSASFWGYLFARVSVLDGIRAKRRRGSSTFLCASLFGVSCLLVFALLFWKWELPVEQMIVRDYDRGELLELLQ